MQNHITHIVGQWNIIKYGIDEAIHDALNPIRQADGFLDLEKSRDHYNKVLGKLELLRNMDESCHHEFTKLKLYEDSLQKQGLISLKDRVFAEFEKLDKHIATLEGALNEAFRISELMKK